MAENVAAYFDVETTDDPVTISMTLGRKAVSRLWEVKVTQIPFTQRAPAGCLQYHTGVKGLVQTMNFADNGRHLANQDYNICMRQEEGMCSIAYEPCHENSFKIEPNNSNETAGTTGDDGSIAGNNDGMGSGDGGLSVGRGMEICSDKIVMPCDSEDLLFVKIAKQRFKTCLLVFLIVDGR